MGAKRRWDKLNSVTFDK